MTPQANYTVGTSAMRISQGRTRNGTITITNLGTGRIFLGDSTVTTANGSPLEAGERIMLTRELADSLVCKDMYAVSASGTNDVRVLTGLAAL